MVFIGTHELRTYNGHDFERRFFCKLSLHLNSFRRLIPLPLELQQHPQLAQLFSLSDVVPSCMNSVKWSEAVMHILRELTPTTDDMWVKFLADVGPGNVAILHCPELNVSTEVPLIILL